jgi:integrase/recombinase XerD
MLTDAEGKLDSSIHLRDEASKGRSGRIIPLNKDLKVALQRLHDRRSPSPTSLRPNERSKPRQLQSSISLRIGIG